MRYVKKCNIHLNFSTRKEIYTEILVLNLEKRGRAGREILVLHLEKAYPTFTGDPMAAPVAESQNLMVLSLLHDTMVLPVGSKQTPVTMSVWPVRVDWHTKPADP